MKKAEEEFIELTRIAINCDYSDECFGKDSDWGEIFKLAAKNGLLAVLADAVKNNDYVTEELKKRWGSKVPDVFFRQSLSFKQVAIVTEAIAKAGYDYAVFKGPIVAASYPNALYRSSSDTDILVDEKDIVEVEKIITSLGYLYVSGKSKEKVHNYLHEKTRHLIELHSSVFEDYEGTKIKILENAGFNDKSKWITVNVKGKNIRTLGYNEHFIYLVFHMIKHFMLEGANVRLITDITLFYNKNKDAIDTKSFWEWMDKCSYTAFCENFFTICVKFFGMDSSIMSGRCAKTSYEVLDRMLIDFIYVGDVEEQKTHKWQLVNTISPYFTGDATAKADNKFERVISFAFPRAEMLGERYSYAKKHKILLPVAWGHRCVYRMIWHKNQKENYYTGMQKINAVDSKLKLLGSVGLLDKE